MIKAYCRFSQNVNKYMLELNQSLLKGNKKHKDIMKKIKKLDIEFRSCIQESRSKKYFIDLDLDFEKNILISDTIPMMNYITKKLNLHYWIIETHSGYHFLIEKNSIDYNFYETIKNTEKKFDCIKEFKINKNEMIPIPGTLQGNKLVRLIKERFKE